MNFRAASNTFAKLTVRERDVLHWVCECKTDAEIGRILGISVHTVSKHLQRAFRKLGVENRMAAARIASFAHGPPRNF
jgi:DNA-binding CsgD family transcriptional regulator